MTSQKITTKAYVEEQVSQLISTFASDAIFKAYPDHIYIKAKTAGEKDILIDKIESQIQNITIKIATKNKDRAFILKYRDVVVPEDYVQKERPKKAPVSEQKTIDPRTKTIDTLQQLGLAVWIEDDICLGIDSDQETLAKQAVKNPELLKKASFISKISKSIRYGADELLFHIELADRILKLRNIPFSTKLDVTFADSNYPKGRSNPFIFATVARRNAAMTFLGKFLAIKEHDDTSFMVIPKEKLIQEGTVKRRHPFTHFLIETFGIKTTKGNHPYALNITRDKKIYTYNMSADSIDKMASALENEFKTYSFKVINGKKISYKERESSSGKPDKKEVLQPKPKEATGNGGFLEATMILIKNLGLSDQETIYQTFFSDKQVELPDLKSIKEWAHLHGYSLIKKDAIL